MSPCLFVVQIVVQSQFRLEKAWTTIHSHPQPLINIGLLLDYFCKPEVRAQQKRTHGNRRKSFRIKVPKTGLEPALP
jgi:hypothetical protein